MEFCPQELYRSEICPYPRKGNLPVGILHIGILPYGILPAGNLPSRVTIHVSTSYSKILYKLSVICFVAQLVEHQAISSDELLLTLLMEVRAPSQDQTNIFWLFLLNFSNYLGAKFLRADFLFGITGRFPTCKIPAGKIPTSRFPRADFHGQISGVLIFCGQNSCMLNSYGYNSKQVKFLQANILRPKFPRVEIQMVEFLQPSQREQSSF